MKNSDLIKLIDSMEHPPFEYLEKHAAELLKLNPDMCGNTDKEAICVAYANGFIDGGLMFKEALKKALKCKSIW